MTGTKIAPYPITALIVSTNGREEKQNERIFGNGSDHDNCDKLGNGYDLPLAQGVIMVEFKPMLSGKAPDDLTKLNYPVAVSPKLDGFRAIVIDGVVMSRNLKPIRNKHVQSLFGWAEFNGFDGELIVGDPTSKSCFRDTSSGVTRADGEPDVKFYVFDNWNESHAPWRTRFLTLPPHGNLIIRVEHLLVFDSDGVLEEEQRYLEQGYEGLMIRDQSGPYKQGRSTTREGFLLKLKRFEDGEALVIGMEEKMRNANEATKNALGHTQRTSHQENLVPMDTMGALVVRDLKTDVVFNIGTGFDDAERDRWWGHPERENALVMNMNDGGNCVMFTTQDIIVKYKYFAQGSKDKPRFPTYLGIRDKDDV